ncbi:MAG: NADH-quinone oxidoreductase subunit NuoE [candidate division Zixibacteria bacterium]|nr:NADH-quinone oxidoreductase subunit NuoE [candidate division Zixibacteria bacterium]
MEWVKAKEIISQSKERRESLIEVLQDIQAEYNYLPREVLNQISQELQMPLSQVLRVATFYAAFSLKPRGRHLINVCLGTACHVRGGGRILEKLERELGIKSGEASSDLKFSLETVRCIGCCSLAPVIRIDEDTHGRLRQDKIPRILKKYT